MTVIKPTIYWRRENNTTLSKQPFQLLEKMAMQFREKTWNNEQEKLPRTSGPHSYGQFVITAKTKNTIYKTTFQGKASTNPVWIATTVTGLDNLHQFHRPQCCCIRWHRRRKRNNVLTPHRDGKTKMFHHIWRVIAISAMWIFPPFYFHVFYMQEIIQSMAKNSYISNSPYWRALPPLKLQPPVIFTVNGLQKSVHFSFRSDQRLQPLEMSNTLLMFRSGSFQFIWI